MSGRPIQNFRAARAANRELYLAMQQTSQIDRARARARFHAQERPAPTLEAAAAAACNAVRPANAAALKQLDGTLIDSRRCICPSKFYAVEFEGSLDCPIDDHRIWWLRWHWEFDDRGKVYSSPAIWPSDRISPGRRPRSPGVTGARISA